MANLILFILSAYAAWYVFTTSELPVWGYLRDRIASRYTIFFKFLDCPICSGFWVSLALALLFPLTRDLMGPWFAHWALQGVLVGAVIQAFAGAGAIYLIETHVRRLEEQ